MLCALVAAPLAATPAAKVTFEIGRCFLELRVDGRRVAQGRKRCNNPEHRRVSIQAPKRGAALIETKEHLYYANGGIWATHESRFLAPLLPNQRYVVFEEDIAPGGLGQENLAPHCVRVSADARVRRWYVTSFGESFGPFSPGEAVLTGSKHRRHAIVFELQSGGKVVMPYARAHDGTYVFTLGKRVDVSRATGEVRLSFSDRSSSESCFGRGERI